MDSTWLHTAVSIVGTAAPLAVLIMAGIAKMAARLAILEDHVAKLVQEVERQNGRVRQLELQVARIHALTGRDSEGP